MLAADRYAELRHDMPILCVDLILRGPDGRYFLVKRVNAPRRGEWFVIGGRVFKDEHVRDAVVRKAWEEAGLRVIPVRPVGYYEEFAPEGHFVSVVYLVRLIEEMRVVLGDQSSEWCWSDYLPDSLYTQLASEGLKGGLEA